MNKIKAFLKSSYDKQIDGTGLAIFRITYSIVLLCEIAQMFYFRHLIFDKIPYLDVAEIEFGIPIGIWFISVFFILLGLFTKLSTIVNYLMGLILIGTISSFEYHVFYAYMGVNFLLIFMPISQCLSIDRIIQKIKFSSTSNIFVPEINVSQIHYFIIPYIGLGLVYFDSVFFKLSSSMWYKGLGSWLPSSLPMNIHINSSFLLNQEILVKLIGWGTILFETVFIFLFFKKKFRIPILIIGTILHIGIVLTFPIPWFGLIACSVYILLVPTFFWKRINNIWSSNKLVRKINSSDNTIISNIRELIITSNIPKFNSIDIKWKQFSFKFLFSIIVICTLLQLLSVGRWPLEIAKASTESPLISKIESAYISISGKIMKTSTVFLGITRHPVFTDYIHFNNYNHIISVVYIDKNNQEKWLPIIDKNGMPDWYIYGSNWVNWTFRVNMKNINLEKMNNGIERYSAFWAYKNQIDLDDAVFQIKVKKIETYNGDWEKDFLNRQIAKPWVDGGQVSWKNQVFHSDIKDIESI